MKRMDVDPSLQSEMEDNQNLIYSGIAIALILNIICSENNAYIRNNVCIKTKDITSHLLKYF